jgi:hypothetical protein
VDLFHFHVERGEQVGHLVHDPLNFGRTVAALGRMGRDLLGRAAMGNRTVIEVQKQVRWACVCWKHLGELGHVRDRRNKTIFELFDPNAGPPPRSGSRLPLAELLDPRHHVRKPPLRGKLLRLLAARDLATKPPDLDLVCDHSRLPRSVLAETGPVPGEKTG